MVESKIFVIDISKPLNIISFSPYFCLLYINGMLPVIPGILVESKHKELLSFKPAKFEPYDHLVIIKTKHNYTDEQIEVIVEVLINNLNDDQFIKLAEIMKKRLTKSSGCKISNASQAQLDKLNLIPPLTTKTKNCIICIWFGPEISGLFMISRALNIIEFKDPVSSDILLCEITNKIKSYKKDYNFWRFEMNYMILMDQNYYVINGPESEDMEWPDLCFPYVGLIEHGQKLQLIQQQTVNEWKKFYLDNHDKDDNYSYNVCTMKNKFGQKRFKLFYGKRVFFGFYYEILKIINSRRFSTWCDATDEIQWEILFGRNEHDKLFEHRQLQKQNVLLQQQIDKLEAQIASKQKQPELNESQ